MIGRAVGVGAVAFAASAALTPAAARLARRLGLVDRPGPLKPHARATPYLGGVGVAGGLALGLARYRPWLLVPAGLALALGVADDARPLGPLTRLAGQLALGGVLAAGVGTRFPDPLGKAAVVAATVTLINGFNLLDGLDALCGSVALVAGGAFGAVLGGDPRLVALALAGGVAGFLVHNVPPAQVFLGDGGSYLIGTTVAGLLALAWAPGQSLPTGIGALALVALPTAELGWAVLRRARSQRSVLQGDRDHPYDRLVRRGWTPGQASAAYAGVELVLAGAAVAGRAASPALAGLLVATALAGPLVASWAAGLLDRPVAEPGDPVPG